MPKKSPAENVKPDVRMEMRPMSHGEMLFEAIRCEMKACAIRMRVVAKITQEQWTLEAASAWLNTLHVDSPRWSAVIDVKPKHAARHGKGKRK